MKKALAFILIFSIALCLFGCRSMNPPVTDEVSFENSSSETLTFDVSKTNFVEIVINLPCPGYIDFNLIDDTSYDDYNEDYPGFDLSFSDAEGNEIKGAIGNDGGRNLEHLFDEDVVVLKLKILDPPRGMDTLVTELFFAKETDAPAPVTIDSGYSYSTVGEDGAACFSFTVKEQSVLDFYVGPVADYESEFDGYFDIMTADGKSATDKLFIHSTEWISRKSFLPEGDYILKLYDSPNFINRCKIETVMKERDALINPSGEIPFPSTAGFTSDNLNTVSFDVKFDKEASYEEQLEITPIGAGTYYDCEQSVDILITNEKGETVYDEEFSEGIFSFSLTDENGDLKVTVTPHDSCYISFSKV